MRVEFYGLTFETPRIAFYLWSPWRATTLEHRLFEVITPNGKANVERLGDEVRIILTDPKLVRAGLQAVERVLKGWQEEAEQGRERRAWRWLLEADVDAHGYDHAGEQACMWAFLRISLERGGPGDGEKGEDFELESFGMQIWPTT